MSTELVACPHCGTNLQNTPVIAGQVVACPQCQGQLQMPALAAPQQATHGPPPVLPEPAPELPQPVSSAPAGGVHIETSSAVADNAPSVLNRIHRRRSPLPIVFGAMLVLILIIAGVFGYMVTDAKNQRDKRAKELIGNWELIAVDGAGSVRSLAFHSDGKVQVLLQREPQPEILEGRWKVTQARGSHADVFVDWLDGTGETWVAQLSGGQLHVELPSVGRLTFRAAAPGAG